MSPFFGRNLCLCIYEISILKENELRKCGGCARTKEKHGYLVNKVVSSKILKCDISRCYPHMKNRCAHLCIYVSDTVLQFWNKYQRPVVSSESVHVSFAHLAAIKASFEQQQKLLPNMTALEKKGFCITDRDAEFSPGWAHPKEKCSITATLYSRFCLSQNLSSQNFRGGVL